MPTNVSKGNHGTSDSGAREGGGQKATYGSSVSPEVATDQAEAIAADGATSAEDLDAVRNGTTGDDPAT